MKIKRVLSMLLTLVMVNGLLVACADDSNVTSEAPVKSEGSSDSDSE